jgi:hypothetical protein
MKNKNWLICQDGAILNLKHVMYVQTFYDHDQQQLDLFAVCATTRRLTICSVACEKVEIAQYLSLLLLSEFHAAMTGGNFYVSDVLRKVHDTISGGQMTDWLRHMREVIMAPGQSELEAWSKLGGMFALADTEGGKMLSDSLAVLYRMADQHLALHSKSGPGTPIAATAELPEGAIMTGPDNDVLIEVNTFQDWASILRGDGIEFVAHSEHGLMIHNSLLPRLDQSLRQFGIPYKTIGIETTTMTKGGFIFELSPDIATIYLDVVVIEHSAELLRMAGIRAIVVDGKDGVAILLETEQLGEAIELMDAKGIRWATDPAEFDQEEEE